MQTAAIFFQLAIAVGIVNVWILRSGKSTEWRGKNAQNMAEEFAAYGLPPWTLRAVGFAKLTLAALLVVGIWYPQFAAPAAGGMAALMVGAIAMHFRVGDAPKKSLPAFLMLAMSIVVVLAHM